MMMTNSRPGHRSLGMKLGIAAGLGVIIWFLPAPDGVTAAAWHLFAIFVATIMGIVLEPLPMGAVALLGIAAATLTRTLTLGEALSGFSNRIIWLVVMAFFISRGFIKTGLGARIAYSFMSLLGRRTLGLGYSMIATDLVLAPVIPSITARAAAAPLLLAAGCLILANLARRRRLKASSTCSPCRCRGWSG